MSNSEPLHVAGTIARLATLYAAAGPRLGCTLVEANVLLLLAGLRASTNIVLFEPGETDAVKLAHLGEVFAREGLRVELSATISRNANRRLCDAILLESLEGYQYISAHTRMCGVTTWDGSGGWEGINEWGKGIFAALREHYEPEPILHDRWVGLLLGYPDLAVDDLCQALAQGRTTEGFIDAQLPATEHYRGAEPIFSYAPAHADDPGILDTIATWSALLEGVYASEWHQQLQTDPAFQAARREREGQRG